MTDDDYCDALLRAKNARIAELEAVLFAVRRQEAARYLAIAESQDGRTEAYEELIAALKAVRDA